MSKLSSFSKQSAPSSDLLGKRGSGVGNPMEGRSKGGVVKLYSMPDGKIVPRLKPGVIDRANAALRSK